MRTDLAKCATNKRKQIQSGLRWLARFHGGLSGWTAPTDDAISERANALANAQSFNATVVSESQEVRERSERRNRAEHPPSHKGAQLNDCRVWEQCLSLLAHQDVVFVSIDKDFVGHRKPEELHPQLQAEAEEVCGGKLTFYSSMKSLLRELESEIPPISDNAVFEFVYNEIADLVAELESKSGCTPRASGDIRQTRLTTDEANVIEVRLEMDDVWESSDGATKLDFRLSGSCRYLLDEKRLTELTAREVNLLQPEPDGSKRAVEGSYVSLEAHFFAGAPPIKPEPEQLD